MSVHIEGLDELEGRLQELRTTADSASGSHEIPMDELLPADFMQTHTEFESLEEFFEESPWTVDTKEDFQSIPGDEFDGYVERNTGFSDWDSMLSAAAREWIAQQISLEA